MTSAKLYGWFSRFLGFAVFLSLLCVLVSLNVESLWDVGHCIYWYLDDYFMIDGVFWYLSFLTVILILVIMFNGQSNSMFVNYMLCLSSFSAIMCYGSNHVMCFWIFYECSILFIFVLVFCSSSYSERFVAFWYFLVYSMVSSLPSLLIILYFSDVNGSMNISHWNAGVFPSSSVFDMFLWFILSLSFIVKIPLFPFYGWLPLVHSECLSIISSCLSGYIMKLGFVGLFRFGLIIFPTVYIKICLIVSLLFFILALFEIDIKRWLAFLSLGHISVGLVCLTLSEFGYSYLGFYYLLGHGISAGLSFVFMGYIQASNNSRNWFLVRRWLNSNLLIYRLFMLVLLIVSSFPPTLQFFVEVEVVKICIEIPGLLWVFCLCLYIGSVCPLIILSFMFGSVPRDWGFPLSSSDSNPGLVVTVLLCIIILMSCWLYV